MATMTVTETLETIRCGVCSITFAAPEEWVRHKKQTGEEWYCPNGHRMHFREPENDLLRKKASRLEQEAKAHRESASSERRRRETAERSAAAHKEQITKLKKRTGAGVCPCCSRSFQQLRRHMENKHPEMLGSE